MQSGGEEAYECRVRWTELRGRGRVPVQVTDILEWVTSPPFACLDPVARVDRIKDLRPGQTFLACSSVSSNKRRQLPPTQSSPACIVFIQRIYTPIAWSYCRAIAISISSTAYVYIACSHLALRPLQLHAWNGMLSTNKLALMRHADTLAMLEHGHPV